MSNLSNLVKQVKQLFGKNATVEQYLFGHAQTFVVVTTSAQLNPFQVMVWNNFDKLTCRGKFDSRVAAHKDASSRWLQQFS